MKKRQAAVPGANKPATVTKAAVTQTAAVVPISAAHRENPEKLSGDALRALAHRRGLPKSDLQRMSDTKIREQLRYLAYRQYSDEAA